MSNLLPPAATAVDGDPGDAVVKRHSGVPSEAEIDVVVPTRDRPVRLASCVESLAAQTFKSFRLTVVDDASRVPVVDALPEQLKELPELQILRNEQRAGPSASRNRGVAAGSAPYVVFLDDDCRAHPDLLSRHRAVLAGGGRLISIGSLHPPPTRRLPPWNMWEADRLAREQGRMARGEVSPSWTHLYTGNVAVRREDFLSAGGFDERFYRQEDVELAFRLHRLGCRFVFEPAAIVWHDTERSLEAWLTIPAESARGDVLMDTTVPESERLRWVEEALRQRHWLLRAVRRLLGSSLAGRGTVRLAAFTGKRLHAVRAERLAMLAFSLVWDLEYTGALAQQTRGDPIRSWPRAGRARRPPGTRRRR